MAGNGGYDRKGRIWREVEDIRGKRGYGRKERI
jgi:hypothetical protein